MAEFAKTEGLEHLVGRIHGSGLISDEDLHLYTLFILRSFQEGYITPAEFMTKADLALEILREPKSSIVEGLLLPENMIASTQLLSVLKTGEYDSITRRGRGFYTFMHNHIPEIAYTLFSSKFYEEVISLHRPIKYAYKGI